MTVTWSKRQPEACLALSLLENMIVGLFSLFVG
jgi:hypothetical protein